MGYTSLDDALVDGSTGLPVYGMDKEIAEKKASKWSEGGAQLEQEARAWIEAVLGESLECGGDAGTWTPSNLHEALQDGVVLCRLLNCIRPCSCKPTTIPSKMKGTKWSKSHQMDNIAMYIGACESLGVRKEDSFQSVALFEKKDMLAVSIAIRTSDRDTHHDGTLDPNSHLTSLPAGAPPDSGAQLRRAPPRLRQPALWRQAR